jgi:hypothetical protein
LNGYSKTAGGFILALLVAVAFTGSPQTVVGIHAECEDAIDNDGDTDIDAFDDQCWEYPFADGGAEYGTTQYPNGKMWSSDSYSMTLHEWRLQQIELNPPLGGSFEHQYCDSGRYSAEYALVATATNGEDNSEDQYTTWHSENCN